jgi:hypothetical protein
MLGFYLAGDGECHCLAEVIPYSQHLLHWHCGAG